MAQARLVFQILCVALMAVCTRALIGPDVSTLCDSVTCDPDTCRVVKKCLICHPQPVCLSRTPAEVDHVCLSNAYRSTVLSGWSGDPSSLTPLPCRRGKGCPRGATCVSSGGEDGVCCFQKVDCTESLDKLFQSSLTYNGRTYLLSNIPSYTSDAAEAICEARGGYLAEIDDADENTALKNFVAAGDLNGNIGALISGTDVQTEGSFVFQFTGKDVVYTDFDSEQPDNLGDADCLQLLEREDFQWDDIPCDRRDVLFLCEIP